MFIRQHRSVRYILASYVILSYVKIGASAQPADLHTLEYMNSTLQSRAAIDSRNESVIKAISSNIDDERYTQQRAVLNAQTWIAIETVSNANETVDSVSDISENLLNIQDPLTEFQSYYQSARREDRLRLDRTNMIIQSSVDAKITDLLYTNRDILIANLKSANRIERSYMGPDYRHGRSEVSLRSSGSTYYTNPKWRMVEEMVLAPNMAPMRTPNLDTSCGISISEGTEVRFFLQSAIDSFGNGLCSVISQDFPDSRSSGSVRLQCKMGQNPWVSTSRSTPPILIALTAQKLDDRTYAIDNMMVRPPG